MTKNSLSKSGISSSVSVLLLDVLISALASLLGVAFVRMLQGPVPEFHHYVLFWVLVAIVASLISFLILGTYRIVIRHSTVRSLGRLFIAVAIKDAIIAACLLLDILPVPNQTYGILLMFSDLAFSTFFLIITRVIIVFVFDKLSASYEADVNRLCVMVYGESDKAVALLTRLEQSSHYNIIGFLTREKSDGGNIIHGRKVYWFETEDDLRKLKVNLGVESILFANPDDSEQEKDGLVPMCLHLGIHLLLTPKIEEVSFSGMRKEAIKNVYDNDFIPDGMSAFERNFKRGVDFLLASLLLIVFSPLFLACWIAIKIGGGPGPVIFKQERIGRFGRPFNIYKFRSMRTDAEAAGPALYSGDDDPRLTKVGHFLRAHHLDELPQLWNVFRGDMAFIGYRPERKFYIDKIMEQDPRYFYLYQIRPGVTSYATLRNGYTDTMEKMLRRLEFDLYYLRHRSLWFDIKILWQTFRSIVFGKKF